MLDAVVVNYLTPDDLEGFLESWAANAPDWCSLSVVNVDPGPRDVEIAKSYNRLWSAYWQHDTNVGYAYSCNYALSESEADVVAVFNADTRILPGTIEPLYENLMKHEDWGVVGPRQVDDAGLLTHAGILGTQEKPVLRGWMKPDSSAFCDVVEDAVSVMGSAYFVKRDCWTELTTCPVFQEQHPNTPGAFLPTQHYYEETWCSYHARAHGWKVVYYGLSKMIHRWHKASPVGGLADKQFSVSQKTFRAMCDSHNIARD